MCLYKLYEKKVQNTCIQNGAQIASKIYFMIWWIKAFKQLHGGACYNEGLFKTKQKRLRKPVGLVSTVGHLTI